MGSSGNLDNTMSNHQVRIQVRPHGVLKMNQPYSIDVPINFTVINFPIRRPLATPTNSNKATTLCIGYAVSNIMLAQRNKHELSHRSNA